jgi:hypothetical protein
MTDTSKLNQVASLNSRPGRVTRFALAGAAIVLQGLLYAPTALAQNFGEWSPAVSVDPGRSGINTTVNDGCPIEGPDGNTLFFASNRTRDLEIWVAYRGSEDQEWAELDRLPYPVNSTSTNEFCPTPLPGNRLLFVSTRSNVCGGGANNADLYITRQHPVRGWLEPQHLGCDVNSPRDEFSPALVEANGVTTLYFSSNRDEQAYHKIYSSVLQPDGSWGPATLVDELNVPGASDARPNVRKDGLEIVFDSTRGGLPPQIYTATRSSISEPWSTPALLDANVNFPTAAQTRPSISRDGTRLYFGSTRANVAGDTGSDIFVSTRSGPGRR